MGLGIARVTVTDLDTVTTWMRALSYLAHLCHKSIVGDYVTGNSTGPFSNLIIYFRLSLLWLGDITLTLSGLCP